MPRLATPTAAVTHVSYSIMGADGRIATATIVNRDGDEITAAQTNALANALGDFVNGAVIKTSRSFDIFDNVAGRIAYDETYSGVAQKAALVFQNATRRTRVFEVPCPDASNFLSDRQTIDRNNPRVVALVNAIKAIIDEDDGPYALTRGFLSEQARTSRTNPIPPTLIEPGELSNPPDDPGENPVVP